MSDEPADWAFAPAAAPLGAAKFCGHAAARDASASPRDLSIYSMRFPVRQRLRRQADFLAVRSQGRRRHCDAFLAQLLVWPESREPRHRRLGVIASARTGGAVKRNRAKRVMREIFRHNQDVLPPVCDLVIIIRPGFDRYTFGQIQEYFQQVCQSLARSQTAAR